jgi:leader peptidase (prepilin peptidase)/N-methyltransferase
MLAERTALKLRTPFLVFAIGLLYLLAAVEAEDLREFVLLSVFLVPFPVVAVTDLEARAIPNRVTYPALALALALSWAWPDHGVVDSLIGMAVGFGFMFFPFLISGGRGIAAGDVKLAALIGATAAWPAVIPGLFVGVISGGVAALVLAATTRSGKTAFAYGPFLALGGAVALLYGEAIVDWYTG